jgi:uncharacterized protein YceK
VMLLGSWSSFFLFIFIRALLSHCGSIVSEDLWAHKISGYKRALIVHFVSAEISTLATAKIWGLGAGAVKKKKIVDLLQLLAGGGGNDADWSLNPLPLRNKRRRLLFSFGNAFIDKKDSVNIAANVKIFSWRRKSSAVVPRKDSKMPVQRWRNTRHDYNDTSDQDVSSDSERRVDDSQALFKLLACTSFSSSPDCQQQASKQGRTSVYNNSWTSQFSF